MASLQWFFLPALVAIGTHVKRTGQTVTAATVSQWATNDQLDFPEGIAELALTSLQRRGYLQSPRQNPHAPRTARAWQISARGLHAAQAALQSLPGAAPDVQALPTRVWNLLRIRRRLTAIEAAETLIDAEQNFDAQAKRIGALLNAWAKLSPDAVVTAKKREANGRVRYVLVKDLGRWPPPFKPGQVHPSEFSKTCSIPARYLKAAHSLDADSEGSANA